MLVTGQSLPAAMRPPARWMLPIGYMRATRSGRKRLQGELGFGQIMALMCIGDTPHERVVRTMELFAREVAPNFRSAPVPA